MCGWAGTTGALAGEDRTLNAFERQFDLADRQRMLLQRMAKATCFVLAGVDPQRHADMAWLADYEFGAALQILQNGNDNMGVGAAEDQIVRDELHNVGAVYQAYGAAVQQIIHGDRHSAVLYQVLTLDDPALLHMEAALSVMKGRVADRADAVIGRQRMLSQQMGKNFCFATLGIDEARQRSELQSAAAEFETTFDALIADLAPRHGPGQGPWTDLYVFKMRGLWAQMPPLVDAALRGAPLSPAQGDEFARLSDALLDELERGAGSLLIVN